MERFFYKNPKTGAVFEYESERDRDAFGHSSLVRMSEKEVDDHLNPSPAGLTRTEVEAQRLRAYADPITGSDRYFAEAQRESLIGNSEAAEAAKALGLARFAEIQADNPWPAE